jgi:putative spermidine/putrescine transport system substrate-binding protein
MSKRSDFLSEALFGNQRAMRRQMQRDIEEMSRREVFRRTGKVMAGASAAAMLFQAGIPLIGAQDATPEAPAMPEYTEIPEALKGSGEVRVQSWGGAFQDAQREAYFKPFEELTGIRVIEGEGPDVSKIKAWVDTGNVEYDIVQVDLSNVILLENEGDYWEEIDYSIFDTENIPETHRYKYSVDMLPYGTVIGYRTDVFEEGPTGQADFWDLDAFPGPRSTIGGTGGVTPFLEAALIADGVPMDEIYPIDIERAFNSLDRIRDSVVKFWEAGAEPAQLLTDKEAVMVHSWNGRMAAIQKEGAPVGVVWNEAMLATDVWATPMGAANSENAFKFMAFITLAESQARLATLIPYGFVNNRSAEFLTADQLENLPTAPAYREIMFDLDVPWWVENRDAVLDYWNEWILG